MAKKHTKKTSSPKSKGKTIFDLINNINRSKIEWSNLSEDTQTKWNTFLVNRFLSMNVNNVDLINSFQKYTYSISNKAIHEIYRVFMPKTMGFYPYIKAKTIIGEEDEKLITILCQYFEASESEIQQYLHLAKCDEEIQQELNAIAAMYGMDNAIKRQ